MTKKSGKSRRARLEGPFTAIARAQSKHWGVTIQASGASLCTDGEVIKFPWNGDDIETIPFQVLNGYLDHEVGHVAEEREHRAAGKTTPMDLMRAQKNITKRMLLNVFEDIRMELKRGRLYPGVQDNLKATNKHSVETFQKRFGEGDGERANFWHTLGCGIIMRARGLDTSWMPEGYAPFMALCEPEIEASRTTVWVADNIPLVNGVYNKITALAEALKDYEEAATSPDAAEGGAGEGDEARGEDGESTSSAEGEGGAEGDGATEGEGDGDEGDAEGEGDASGQPADSEGTEGEGEGTEGKGTEGEGEGANEDIRPSSGEKPKGEDEPGEGALDDGADIAPSAPAPPCDDADKACDLAEGALATSDTEDILKDDVGKEIQAASEELGRSGEGYMPNPHAAEHDAWITPDKYPQEAYNAIRSQVAQQVSALRARLIRIIRTRTESRVQYDKEHGRLDTSNLHQLRLGSKRVFSQTVKGDDLDTAVTILVDLSGSMGWAEDPRERSHYARLTTIALSEALNDIGVPFEVIGWNNTYKHGRPGSRRHGSPYVNRLPFEYYVYKAFGENHRHVRTRMVGITGMEENVDGEAVLEVGKRLALRPEGRKLMFVISDGSPACPGLLTDAGHVGKSHLHKAIKVVRDSGIILMGIGVQHSRVATYYGEEYSVVIDDLNEMAVNIFKTVRSALFAGLRRSAA